MKKRILSFALLVIIIIASPLGTGRLYAQSVEISPNQFSVSNLQIKNSLNQPGLIHSSTAPGGPSMGTVIKADGAYLQTFTNHPLKFAINNGSELYQVTPASNVVIKNGAQFGATNFKQIKFEGFTDGYDPANAATNDGLQYETRITHGLDASKIISIKMIIIASPGFSIGEEYTFSPGYRAAVSHDPTFLHVWNYQTNSQNIRNKPFKVLITYLN
jgi:hypothetical protein